MIFSLTVLLKERANSIIKYISLDAQFYQNQLRHHMKHVTSRNGENYEKENDLTNSQKHLHLVRQLTQVCGGTLHRKY